MPATVVTMVTRSGETPGGSTRSPSVYPAQQITAPERQEIARHACRRRIRRRARPPPAPRPPSPAARRPAPWAGTARSARATARHATIGGMAARMQRAVRRGGAVESRDEAELVERVAHHARARSAGRGPRRGSGSGPSIRRTSGTSRRLASAKRTAGEGERREPGEGALGDGEVDAPDEDDEKHAEVGQAGRRAAGRGRSGGWHGRSVTPPGRSTAPLSYRHVTVPHPQLLHRRPHRSRQVHAGRPADRGDRHAREARDAGAGARHDGPRARARHHHQAQRRADELHRRATARSTSST